MSSTALRLSRAALREISRFNPEGRRSQLWLYIASEVRRPSSGDESEAERLVLFKEYISYLKNSREHRELLSCYQGRGERSTEESANLVGLKLPEKQKF